jgi:DNA polymerase
MTNESAKSWLRLWLRSERAMGLSAVGPLQWSENSSDNAMAFEPPQPMPPVAVQPSATPRLAPPRVENAPAAPVPIPASPRLTGGVIAPPPAPDLQMPQPGSGSFTTPVLPVEQRRLRLAEIDEGEVRNCTKCPLCQTRANTVFGEGAADARLMFIGEGPGNKEDQTGRPFVGPAGELLNRMIGAMGLQREQVYIANIVKCRAFMPGPPPKDRAPDAEEVAACSPYLQRQVEIIRPQVIVTLGLPASQYVLQTRSSMSRLRGTWNTWFGIKVMPTWHPAYLLRREKDGDVEPKRQAWSDLQKVMAELGLVAPRRGE